GVNVPSVGLVAFCRVTGSLTIFRQQLGRGLRPGKDKLIVLDFVGNLERIQFVLEMMNKVSDLHEKFTPKEEMDCEGYVRQKFEVSGKGFEFTFSDKIVDAMKIFEAVKKASEPYNVDELISQLVRLAEKLGSSPRHEDIQNASKNNECASVSTFTDRFGSLANALRAAGLKVNKENRYSREVLLEQLKAFAEKLGHSPTVKEIGAASKKREFPSTGAFDNMFGSLNKALEAAGLPFKRRSYDGEEGRNELLAQLQSLAKELGHTPTSMEVRDACKAGKCATAMTFITQFGSFLSALRAAGLSAHQPTYTKEEIIKQLKTLADKLGRTPATSEIDEACKQRTCAGTQTLRDRFGSVVKALKAAGLEPTWRQKARQ
ncbi:MAG TPA: hypothetical protein VE933_03970, partial [Chitinophagaceae bacterium]|nr:hypothetical protein [Chitinophagaceae bacterium]